MWSLEDYYDQTPKRVRIDPEISKTKPLLQSSEANAKKPGYAEILEELDQSMMEEMAPNVSTFIFKGEEYVQMPKKDYMAERELYQNELRKYKSIFNKIKNTINSIHDC